MKNSTITRTASAFLCGVGLLAATTAWSAPKALDLYAKVVYLNPITGATLPASGVPVSGDGLIPMWGFAATADGEATVPGPQIDVTPAEFLDGIQITVHNGLSESVSLVIPGLNTSTDLGQPTSFAGDPNYGNRVRSLVPEVAPGSSRSYTWTNLKPGTFVYHSGSHPALQVQMGLFGMVTIKEAAGLAYPGVAIGSGGEVPVIFSEIDPVLHWAVHTNGYGPGKAISSTIHSEPSLFLINGRAHDPTDNFNVELTPSMKNGWTTLFRVINVGWDSHIPSLTGPFPSGSANYLRVIAEDGEPYPYPKTLYAPNLAALKTMDIQFTPPAGENNQEYQVYDRKLGLANGGGMFRKVTASGTIDLCDPAAISVGPVSQAKVYGDNVEFTVTASGTAPLIYQWRKDNVNLPGATSSTLTLAGVTSASEGSYDVVVANGCGLAISAAATLTVCVPVAIASGPISQTVDYGTTVTYSVALQSVPSPSGPINYQWRRNSGNLADGGNISGATSSTLTLSSVTQADAGSYDVVIVNGCGTATSTAATLTVRPVFVRSTSAFRSSTAVALSLTTPPIQINGTGKLLVVAANYYDSAGTPSIESVTTVPSSGSPQAFTRLSRGQFNTASGGLDLWYLIAPNDAAANTCTVRVNFASGRSLEQIAVVVDLFNGVNQTTPFGAALTDYTTGTKSSISQIPASSASDLVINWLGYNSRTLTGGGNGSPISVTDGPGQTARGTAVQTSRLGGWSASVRVTSKTGSSPTTPMSETFGSSTAASMGSVAIKP